MNRPEPSASPSPPAPAGSGNALPVGQRLHEFEIEGLIGEGGFGIVYLARDTMLQRTVAIKEYMPAALASRGPDLAVSVRSAHQRETFALGLRSFVNEARLLASFDHPALVKVYRFWEDHGTAYMVMPFYQGPTLKNWLRERGHAPDEAWLKALLVPLLDALSILHADAVYHRDIAPDNILLLGPDKPLLLDFGAARRVIGDATQALTVILKPGYAPVEQYAEVPSMKQGPWTDVYALSAVLYAVVMGKAPPPSVGRMMKDDMVPLAEAAAGRYTAPFLAAIDAGLVIDPTQRIPDIPTLRDRLFATRQPSAYEAALNAYTPTVMVPRPAAQAASKPVVASRLARRPGLVGRLPQVLLGIGLAGLLAAAGVWWTRPRPTPTTAPAPSTAPSPVVAASQVAALPGLALPPPEPPAPAPVPRPPFSIQTALDDLLRQADPALQVSAQPNQSRLVIGRDRLLFRVKSSQPGYVYVYLAGTDASHFYLLFPNALDDRNRIEADRVIELPRRGWHITAGGPPGVNRIVTVVSPTPRDLGPLSLNTRDSIPEFDLAQAARLWASHTGPGSPFVGPARCETGRPCDTRFGAAEAQIEEVTP